MIRNLLLCTAALALTAAPALAKEAPPAPAAAKPFALPPLTEFTLANGMKVTMAQHGNVPKVTIVASVRTGNIDDGQNVWLADLTGALMQKGAGGRDASQLAEAAAGMGGSLALSTGLDSSSAMIDVLGESTSDAVALVADLLQRPDFKAEELEKVRADMLRNLMVAKSTPGSIASEAFSAALYPEHPYGRTFPTPQQLSGYTLEQIKAFHSANFGAARTHLYIVGRFDPAMVRAAVEKAFGGWTAGAAPTALPVPAEPAPKVVLIDRPGAPQSTVWIGKRVAKPGYDMDFRATNTLLGGYFSSRITRNIREDKGYTYSPSASLSQRVQGAFWVEDADITAESTGPAITEIYKEIRRMQDTLPTDAEVQSIRNYMNGTFVLGLSSRDGLAGSLANLDVQGLGVDYLNGYVGRASALKAADFQTAAKRELPVDKLSVVIVGPLESVRAQLEKVPEIAAKLPKK
ncbi:pitrilysin family protein [Novosphingobium resinovorum]|uniref:M16 family metallopeptidase n=1 Tax=Novosphingobium TaxID=165696 RepID=UPI001B3C9C44|nr:MULTISPECIES: pitrilysin family protein [Novosphingobium]MBF7012655.1 insulinase family protein [Novosphingobium sp. HR1a]WJM27388.1 pitrilysin family protein [Novosphingobium resinovorum]